MSIKELFMKKTETPVAEVSAHVELKPHQPLWDAIALKQDKIKSSDQIDEGASHLFFTEPRFNALISVVKNHLESMIKVKQDAIASTDQLPEGVKNKYYSDAASRLACITSAPYLDPHLAPASHVVTKLIDTKQDKISSTDDVKEGSQLYFTKQRSIDAISEYVSQTIKRSLQNHPYPTSSEVSEGSQLYFTEERAAKAAFKAGAVQLSDVKVELLPIMALIDKMNACSKAQIEVIKKLSERISALENHMPVGAGSFNGSLVAVTKVTPEGACYQSLEVKDGLVTHISEESKVKRL